MEGSIPTTQVAIPHLRGQTKSHLLNLQKQQVIPELCEQPMMSVALEVADDEHWNVVNDPIIQLVWQSSGKGMRLLKPLKQISQAQEEEVPYLK